MRIQQHMLGLGRVATLIATLIVATCSAGQTALAGTTQAAMFTGFLSVPGTGTGMDILNDQLSTLGLPDYEGQVFSSGNQQAREWSACRSRLDLL